MKFIDPLTFARLSSLRIRVRQVVEGLLAGLHSSPLKGHSLEFAQHREYSSGDELRHIDWKVYGRSDRFFVKQYQDETNLRAYIALDASASMGFSSGSLAPKLDYARKIAAALSYILLRQEDAVSVAAFDTAVRAFVPPHHSLSHFGLIMEALEKLEPAGRTDISSALQNLGKLVKKRSLIIVISDFLSDQENIIRALKYFRFRHHEVMALQVLDPREVVLDLDGERYFVNMENGRSFRADADEIAGEYGKLFRAFMANYSVAFRKAGIAHSVVTTDTGLEAALERCLAGRT